MPADPQPVLTLSQGERLRRTAYAVTAVIGAVLALAVAVRLGHGDEPEWTLSTYDVWVTLAGFAGGFVGLRLTEHLFGHPGWRGALRALGGIVLICLTTPIVAGSLALPLYGTMFGPFMFGTTLFAVPLLGLIWAGTLLAVHFCLAPWRRERESLFRPVVRRQAAGFRARPESSGSP
jgi:hypothetical protein